ncbi:MAG: hypothetical protein ACI8RZ_005862 [Myxococcota bacterium]|jgi:hypothetical protein
MNPPSPSLIRLRGLVFVLAAVWMIGGPLYRQALNGPSKIPRSWMMFTGYAAGEVCNVEYRLRDGAGESVLDRFAVMGYADRWDAPSSVRRLAKKKDAVRLGERLCRKIEVEDPDIRLYARCAHRKGWRVVSRGKENLCAK